MPKVSKNTLMKNPVIELMYVAITVIIYYNQVPILCTYILKKNCEKDLLTSAILIANVRKPPNIAQVDRKPNHRQ